MSDAPAADWSDAPLAPLVRKGAYAQHPFRPTPVAELRWLWSEVCAHVLTPYPFVRALNFEFAIAYDDSFYTPHTGLHVDDCYLASGKYIYETAEYPLDPGAQTFPTVGLRLDSVRAYELARRYGADADDGKTGPGGGSSFERERALVSEHYGHYRAPLLAAHSLLGAVMHDFEVGYFVWLLGYGARATFTREGVAVADFHEFGSLWHPGLEGYRRSA